jgi:RHS repeat-associated protein
LEQLLDYHSYGTIRLDEKAGEFSEQRKFTGHDLDDTTGFTYMQARYYNGITGRFLSQDPVFWEMPKEYLLDPQQQNSYSYARNNPINRVDPDGRLNVEIPGTNWGRGWVESKEGKQLISNVSETFGGITVVFANKSLWSGENNDSARQEGALNLKNFIDSYFSRHPEDSTLNIIGHSHGGNVAALYSQIANRKIDNLVTLGTPIRTEYKFNEKNIGNHYNVYSMIDFVQTGGGSNLSKAIRLADAYSDNKVINTIGKVFSQFGEVGNAGRVVHESGVININATALTTKALPFVGPHSKLWTNQNVWRGVSSIINKNK